MGCDQDQFAVFGIILGILAACLVGVFALGAAPDVSWLHLLQAAGPLLIAVGAVIAYMNFRHAVQKALGDELARKSKSYLDEAVGTLERAFELLMSGKHRPPNDRLTWLSTARTLLAYEEIKHLVSQDDHKVILSEREEYWKKKFFDMLHPKITGFDVDYFRGSVQHQIKSALAGGGSAPTTVNMPTPLDYHSVAVIYSFCNWPKGRPDPIKNVDVVAKFLEDTTVLFSNHGMRQWLEEDHPNIWRAYQESAPTVAATVSRPSR